MQVSGDSNIQHIQSPGQGIAKPADVKPGTLPSRASEEIPGSKEGVQLEAAIGAITQSVEMAEVAQSALDVAGQIISDSAALQKNTSKMEAYSPSENYPKGDQLSTVKEKLQHERTNNQGLVKFLQLDPRNKEAAGRLQISSQAIGNLRNILYAQVRAASTHDAGMQLQAFLNQNPEIKDTTEGKFLAKLAQQAIDGKVDIGGMANQVDIRQELAEHPLSAEKLGEIQPNNKTPEQQKDRVLRKVGELNANLNQKTRELKALRDQGISPTSTALLDKTLHLIENLKHELLAGADNKGVSDVDAKFEGRTQQEQYPLRNELVNAYAALANTGAADGCSKAFSPEGAYGELAVATSQLMQSLAKHDSGVKGVNAASAGLGTFTTNGMQMLLKEVLQNTPHDSPHRATLEDSYAFILHTNSVNDAQLDALMRRD